MKRVVMGMLVGGAVGAAGLPIASLVSSNYVTGSVVVDPEVGRQLRRACVQGNRKLVAISLARGRQLTVVGVLDSGVRGAAEGAVGAIVTVLLCLIFCE